MSFHSFNEAETRYNLIDPLLVKAGWNLSDRTQIWFEVPVDGYDASPQNGITDYCLFRSNGDVLAVIEAKKTSRDARVGKEQVFQYITAIEKKQGFRPFAFLANGEDIYFWDSEAYPERLIAGFYTREDLERLLHLKQNCLPLNTITINDKIVNRSYQTEAIRRIGEAIEKRKKRKALLVMATGTGKTRTTMALIDVFLRARQAQKVLFLADRDSLVEQALTDGFKVYLPNEARTRIRTYNIDKTARVYVSTLQTLEMCYEKFSPAEFDLIVADECHRSIYNKYTDVLAYFDAIQIGLTATPAHFIDRDTFRFFETDGTSPTFLYTYDKAVKEGYLADYNVYSAQTKFQRKGIKGIELSKDEQASLRERGIDPEDINFEGTDLEKKVTNKDTLHRQWEEFMDVCHKDASGQLPAKTIVFAITQKHALRLEEAFNEMYPEHKGQLARVITSGVERAPALLKKFKKEDMPRIAISVDMLDTGVDVPEVMNLAFMKPVGSQIKFWQMIGRGTRSQEACKNLQWLPERKKDSFLIVDFWENFEHFNMMPKDDTGTRQIPVLVTIFNTRLSKLEILLSSPGALGLASPPAPLRGDAPSSDLESTTGEGGGFSLVVDEPLIAYARALRKNQTKAEEYLWHLLRDRRLNGLKFRRQHPVHPAYILDFYCDEKKLAVELDGAHHSEHDQKLYDEDRTRHLNLIGINVIRFSNNEVLNNIDHVLQQILLNCVKNPPPSPDENSTTETGVLYGRRVGDEENSAAHGRRAGDEENSAAHGRRVGDEENSAAHGRRVGDEESTAAISRIISDLRSDIARIPLDSFTVKKSIKDVREAWENDFWKYLTPQKIELLRMKVAPLLRFVPDVNLPETFFTSKMERCGLALLQMKLVLSASNGEATSMISSIREDVDLLPSSIAQVQEKMSYKEAILSNKFWQNPTLAAIDDAKSALAPLMRYKRSKPSLVIELGLDDVIESRKWVVVREKSGGQKLMVEEYRKKVEEKIEQLATEHPTIVRLKNGETVDTHDLLQLEQTLESELSSDELNLNEDNMLKAFGIRVGNLTDFLKHVLKLESLPSYEQIVRKAFDAFILEHSYNADQTRFLRTVQTVFMQKRKLEEADLYEAPFTNFGSNAVEKFFSQEEIEELMELTKKLAA